MSGKNFKMTFEKLQDANVMELCREILVGTLSYVQPAYIISVKQNKRPVGLIAPPITCIIDFLAIENLPKVSSNIAQNHSSGL